MKEQNNKTPNVSATEHIVLKMFHFNDSKIGYHQDGDIIYCSDALYNYDYHEGIEGQFAATLEEMQDNTWDWHKFEITSDGKVKLLSDWIELRQFNHSCNVGAYIALFAMILKEIHQFEIDLDLNRIRNLHVRNLKEEFNSQNNGYFCEYHCGFNFMGRSYEFGTWFCKYTNFESGTFNAAVYPVQELFDLYLVTMKLLYSAGRRSGDRNPLYLQVDDVVRPLLEEIYNG